MAQPGYEGFGVLGDLLAGGPGARAQEKYPQYLKQSADSYSALDRAAIVRAQRLARDNLPAAIAGDPQLAQHGSLAASILGMATGQPNLGTYTKGLDDLGDMELDRQITEALGSGDTTRAQQLSAVKTDKVLPTLGANGKAVFTPIGGDVELTPLGDADVDATQALGEQRRANGQAATTRADAYADHQREPKPAHASRIQTRAATLDEDIDTIEHELGRTVTPAERAAYLQGKPIIDNRPLGGSRHSTSHSSPLDEAPVAMPSASVKHPPVPAAAVDALRKNPALRAQFAEKYGDVAARVALGQ